MMMYFVTLFRKRKYIWRINFISVFRFKKLSVSSSVLIYEINLSHNSLSVLGKTGNVLSLLENGF